VHVRAQLRHKSHVWPGRVRWLLWHLVHVGLSSHTLIPYSDLIKLYPQAPSHDIHHNLGNWYFYNGIPTIQLKTQLGRD
jgi:hypothetical protein